VRFYRRAAAAVLAAGVLSSPVLLSGTSNATSDHRQSDRSRPRVYTLTNPEHGNPEGITFDPQTRSFYTGSVNDGTIYRGRLNDPLVRPFIPQTGTSSVGMHERRGVLFVAGGTTGSIRLYSIAARRQIASFNTGRGGFINDLVITGDGDVYATDSVRPFIWHVTARQVRAGSGTPEGIPVGSSIPFDTTPGVFNLNGIVALNDQTLVVVQTNTGNFYRIALNNSRRRGAAPAIQQVRGLNVVGGDGLLLDRGRLVVVTGTPTPRLVFADLRNEGRTGRVERIQTDPNLRGPSTVDAAENRYLVVNADFGGPPPFSIASLPRH
jgi:Cu-Zn family superoxide dismutase